MTQCPFCGETSYYPGGPHRMHPCPAKVREMRPVTWEIEQSSESGSIEHLLRTGWEPYAVTPAAREVIHFRRRR